MTEQKANSAFCFFLQKVQKLTFAFCKGKKRSKAMIVITNNPKVKDYYEGKFKMIYIEGTFRDVLIETRNKVHAGHKLLTHPLTGSIKPNETPYKSIVITASAESSTDLKSLQIIENGLATEEKFSKMKRSDRGEKASAQMKEDFQEVDFSLIKSALG